MEGIIKIGAHQADGIDLVPPQTVANLNVKLRHKSRNNGRTGANLGRDGGPRVSQTALWGP